ncbi:MAG: phage tail tape measure protein, partial [Fervidobacterium sp.]
VQTQQLERLKQIAQDIQKKLAIDVTVNSKAANSLKQLAQSLQQIKQNSNIKVSINVPQNIEKNIQKIASALKQLSNAKVKVESNVTNATVSRLADLAKALQKLSQIQQKTFRFRVYVETNVDSVDINKLQRLSSTLSRAGSVKQVVQTSVADTATASAGGSGGFFGGLRNFFGVVARGVTGAITYAFRGLMGFPRFFSGLYSFMTLPFRVFNTFLNTIKRLDSIISSVSQGIHYVSYSLGTLGRTLLFTSITIATAIQRVVAMNNEIEEVAYRTTVVFNESANSFNTFLNVMNAVKDVSEKTGLSLSKLSETLYYIGAAGFGNLEEARQILEQVGAVGALTGTEPTELFRSLVPVMEAFNLTTRDVTAALIHMAKAAYISPVNLEDFITQLPRLATFAESIYVSFDELLSHMVVLSQAGLLPSTIGSALSQLYLDIIKKAPQLEAIGIPVRVNEEGQLVGISFDEILRMLKEKAPTTEEAKLLVQQLGLQKRSTMALLLLLENYDKIQQVLKNIEDTTGDFANNMTQALKQNIPYHFERVKGAFEQLISTLIEVNRDKILKVLQDTEKWIRAITQSLERNDIRELIRKIVEQLFNLLKISVLLGLIMIVLSLILRFVAAVVELLRPMNILIAGFVYGFGKGMGMIDKGNVFRKDNTQTNVSGLLNISNLDLTALSNLLSTYISVFFNLGESFGGAIGSSLKEVSSTLTSPNVNNTLKVALGITTIAAALSDAVADFAEKFADFISRTDFQRLSKDKIAKLTPEQQAMVKIVENFRPI